jgi:hypothetical protein
MFSGKVPLWMFYAVGAYFVVFMVVVGSLYWWRIWRRKERPPEKFKLLRGPGETLRRRVQKADEDLFLYVSLTAFAPLFLGWTVLAIAARLPKPFVLPVAGIALLVFAGSLIPAGALLFRFLHRRRNDFLGYLGERLVSEYLEPLISQGYRVFHDVPAEGRQRKFNLDHVTVGPTGIAVIETKARRKKKGREGFAEHEVISNGNRLLWPWGEEDLNIKQVQAEADWLRDWIQKKTAIRVDPKPIVVIPGWYIKERAIEAVRVANQKWLPSIIAQWKSQPLTPEQIDLICRQLDDRCRDVED